MFKKVLVAEDLDSISIAIVQALQSLSVEVTEHSKYCDDALLKIKKAIHDNDPYDLLITDLSFKIDHRENKLNSGDELIEAVKKIQPDIKTIVFSIEDKSYRIKSLFTDLGINAYVLKGRKSIDELKSAVEIIFESNKQSISAELAHTLNAKSFLEIEAYDISILKLLSSGYTLEDISLTFKNTGTVPNGVSSIEKRVAKLKGYFKANNNVHLIAIAKDLGLI